MSAGQFTRSRYTASYAAGQRHPILVQPETLLLALQSDSTVTNAAPTEAITNPISAVVSLGNREKGLKPRKATFDLVGDAPDNYSGSSRVTLPILNETLFTALNEGVVVTYLGTEWAVVARDPERAS